MRYFLQTVPCLCGRLQPLNIGHHCSLYLDITGYSSHQKSKGSQDPTITCCSSCAMLDCGERSGALTSCRRGYKRSPASFLRLFCKQGSHKAPTKAEGDLWEGISFSYINARARCTFRACWAGASQLDGSKGSSWQELLAMGRGAATLGQKLSLEVSQVQVGCTLSRGVSTEVVAVSFLRSRTYLSYQNPVSSKADICCSSSNSSSLQVCILCQDTGYC